MHGPKKKKQQRCKHYRSFRENGLTSQAEKCRRTKQQISNTVQQVSIDSL